MLLTLYEGRNKQIRKMCDKLGLTVGRLKRVSIGSIKLGMLKPGQTRELKKEEFLSLVRLVEKAERVNAAPHNRKR